MASDTEFDTGLGNGEETHQHISADGAHAADEHLTTTQGIGVSDNQNQLKVGSPGPVQLEDFVLREKIFHFDHECIPERIVHARGWAAHARRRTDSSISQRWPEAQVRLIHRVTSEVSR
jgi:catalase